MGLRGALSFLGNRLIILLLRIRVFVNSRRFDRQLAHAMSDVQGVQEKLLLKILSDQANTEYGLAHGFGGIKTVAEFRERVPVNDYEDLRPWFEKQERDGTFAINAEHPVLYTLTSGTTGKPKLIPVLKSTLNKNRWIQNNFLNFLIRERPYMIDGKIFTVVSSAVEGYTENSRTPYGATTGHMYASAPKLAQMKYVVPPEIFAIADYDLRFEAILRLALACPNITYMTTANPTTLLRLIEILNRDWDRLMEDLAKGGFAKGDLLTEEQQKILLKKLPAMPARARELKQIRDEKSDGRMRISDVWSNIQAAGTWTGGSCSIFFEKLKSEFTAKTLLRDAGYLASEMRGTFPIFSKTSAGIPTFRENYFEFVERDAWENGRKEFLSLTELKDKTEYYIFVTTDAGLYRYNMNDIVKVDGFHGQAPLLRFMQKGKGVTNITGEKVYESQIIAATKAMEAEMGISSSFYMAVASEAELVYRLFYEADRDSIAKLMDQKSTAAALCDKLLGELNIEYRAKRESGRLRPIELVPIEIGTYDLYKRHSIERGQRESQFKIVALLPASDVSFNFSNHKASKVSGRHPLRSESAEAQIS